MDNNRFGKTGESYAYNYLVSNGYRILAKNYRAGKYFEIDIIATKGRTINFIEVKTRKEFEIYESYKAVNNFKVLKIRRGISNFIRSNPKFSDYRWEIKVIMVLLNPFNSTPKVVFYNYID